MEGDHLLIVKQIVDIFYTADYDEDIAEGLEQHFTQSTSLTVSPLQLRAGVFVLAD